MKILFVDERKEREVELVGKVLCTRSIKFDCSWEFPQDKTFNLYKQLYENGTSHFIVFNDESGWYACYDNIDEMKDEYFEFEVIN